MTSQDGHEEERNYFTAVLNRDLDLIRQLLAAHQNVNEQSPDPTHYHRTALHLCVWENYLDGARLLLDAGADVNALDDLHDSPFLLAGAEGRLDIMQYLFKNAERTAKYGSQSGRRMKTSVPDFTVVNRFGGSALIPACERGHVEMVRLLVEKGVDVNHYNYYNWTGLLEAIELGGDDREHVDIVKVLIDAGVDVNQVDGQGKTPLFLAKQRGEKRIVALLEAAGAHE